MRAKSVTLDLDGPKITADRFVRAVTAFVELINEVAKDVTGSDRPIRWIISVRPGSVHLSAAAEPMTPTEMVPQITSAISRGIALIEQRAQRPRHFSDVALQRARELASIADGVEIQRARICVASKARLISEKTVDHVDKLLAPTVRDFGTIEGWLQTLSERGGPHFAVYDALTDKPIRCTVASERLQDAWKAFGRRVAVSGFIRYRSTGDPYSIDAEEIRVFPTESELPDHEEVYGILSRG